MENLLYRGMDGDDDADYGYEIDLLEGHFIVRYYFSFLWTGFSTDPVDAPSSFRAIYAPEINPDVVARIQNAPLPREGQIQTQHLFTSLETLTVFLQEHMQAKVWARLVEVVIKGYLGILEKKEDFLDVLQIEERTLKKRLIAQNGGIENFFIKTDAVEKEASLPFKLVQFSNDVCYLIDYDSIEPEPELYSVPCYCQSLNQAIAASYRIPQENYEFL